MTHQYTGSSTICAFSLIEALPPDLEVQLRAIPGVRLILKGRSPRVESPRNAAFIVKATMDAFRFPVFTRGIEPPRLLQAAQEYILASGEYNEKVDGKNFLTEWLFPYQKDACAFTLDVGDATLWMEPGAGKTSVACIWGLGAPGVNTTVTKPGAKFQWAEQIRRFTKIVPHVWKPASSMRKKDLTPQQYYEREMEKGRRPWFVIGWAALTDIMDELLSFPITSVVWDEVHKGKQSKRMKWTLDENDEFQGKQIKNTSSAAYRLACAARRRLATTGTPVDNNLSDFWGQLTLVEPYAWGGTSTKFDLRYCGAVAGEFGGIVKKTATNVEELKQRLSFNVFQVPFTISHKSLPPKCRKLSIIPVEQQVRPSGLADLTKELKGLTIAYARAQQEGRRLSTVMLDRLNEIRMIEACESKKAAIIEKVLERLGSQKQQKIIVFVGRRYFCDVLDETLVKAFEKQGLRVRSFKAHGDVSEEDRHEIVTEYMKEQVEHCVLIATYQSFGESLDLQDTDYLLVAMLPYRPGEISQMEGRVQRHGMNVERNLLIEYLMAERSADERVRQLVIDKMVILDTMTPNSSLDGFSDLLLQTEGRDERIANYLDSMASWYVGEEDAA